MIKANELRIGNCISFQNHLETEKVVTVNARFFSSLAGGSPLEEMKPDEELSNYYSPIELTPELLEKGGFNVTSKGFYQHPNWYNVSLKHLRGTYNLRCNFMDIITNNIDYLHQLQNLYYSLVGSELEVVW